VSSNPKKVVVIGSGISGLATGIYACINGYDTEIIDMHTKTGGQCTAWDRKGYRFDYCLHWVVGTASGPFYDIWHETDALNKNVEIVNHEISVKFLGGGGDDFVIYTDIDRWEAYLKNIAPEDTVPITKMCNAMRTTFRVAPFANPPGLRTIREYLAAIKMMPLLGLWIKHSKQTTHEYFRKMEFKNVRLLKFFNTFYADQDFSAMVFLMMLSWFGQKNAGYPMGGSLPFTGRMAEKFKNLGGKLSMGRKVEKILVENNTASGVQIDDGQKIAADYVISTADGFSTIYNMLDGKYISKQITDAYQNWKLFSPFVQVSFGINKIIPVDCVTQFVLAKNERIGRTMLSLGFSIMNYSFDHTMAPEGKSVLVVRFDCEWKDWEKLEGSDYDAEKKTIEADVIRLLEQQYPGITNSIEAIDVATPRTSVRYTGVRQGAYEGFLPSSKNLGKSINMTLPGLKNFYMAGQWLYPGGGVPPAGQSGKWVAQLICKRDRKIFKTKV
jgi:phytoene dehydrogenase-like protein